jgi:agmatine deiminase
VDRVRDILVEHRIELKTIPGTSDIWCRDYLPVQIDTGVFARFRYAPDYPQDHEVLITDYDRLAPIPGVETCRRSDIVLDEVNVVGWGSRCILTDKIYRENPGIRRADLRNVLPELLEVHDRS